MSYLEAMMKKELPCLQDFSVKSLNDQSYLRLFTTDGNTLFPTNALKNIHIDMYSGFFTAPTEEFMLFMMNNFPNLSHLMCVEKCDSYEVLYQTFNILTERYIVFLRFFKFLFNLRNCTFPNITLSSTIALMLIETLYTDIEKEDSAATPRLHSLSISPKVFSSEQPPDDTIAINIEKKQPKSLHIHLRFIWDTSRHFNFNIAQLDTLEQIGRFFDIVSVVAESYTNFTKLLNCITAYCTRLKQCTVLGSRWWKAGERLLNQQVESLIGNISLTKLTLCKCDISQEQLLCVVSQLPSLETLVFKDYIASEDQDLYSMHLPNLSLKCLELDMETDLDDSLSLEGFYIKLITEVDPIPRCCFLMKEYDDEEDRTAYRLAPDSSESAYNNNTLDIAVYDIYLKSVEKFTIKYVDAENGYQKTTIDMHHAL